MNNLTFLSPASYLLLCALGALLLSILLYYFTTQYQDQPRWKRAVMAVLRFFSFFLISALLLSPFLKYNSTSVAKPLIVIGQDFSGSIASNTSTELLDAYEERLRDQVQELEKDYDVSFLGFGEKIHPEPLDSFVDKVSNISAFTEYVAEQFNDRNLGAVVIATDGIYNEGMNPIYTHNQINAPIYTIAFGDTTIQRDAAIKRVYHNEITYLGDQFVVQVDVAANNCEGNRSNLVLSKVLAEGTTRLDAKTIAYEGSEYFTTEEFIIDADQPGVQRYRLSLSPLNGESNRSNNYRDLFIDVLDARQNILIYASAPHPDLTAIKQSLERNKNYEVEVAIFGQLEKPIAEYDFVIFHQLPTLRQNIRKEIDALNVDEVGRLFVIGAETHLPSFNSMQNVVSIQSSLKNSNDVQAQWMPSFTLFTLDDDLKNNLSAFPPMQAPFGEYATNPAAQNLLLQSIGNIETDYPLLSFLEEGNLKTGVLAAEGFWRWRLFDFLQREEHTLTNELIGKTVQYLSLKEDKRKFKVTTSTNIYKENEEILLNAELYNASFELVNEPDVFISIYNENNEEYTYTFDRIQNYYTLNAGLFPTGNYRFIARTQENGQQLTFNGRFSIQPIQLENYVTTADHAILRIMANHRQGEMLYPSQVDQLATKIQARADVRPIAYSNTETQSFLNLKWVLFALVLILLLEWFLRRYFGGY